MKIIYNEQKKGRFKCSSFKINNKYHKKYHRFPIFFGVDCSIGNYWWIDEIEKWCEFDKIPKGMSYGTHCHKITNVKQFVRYLKKWERYLPKGIEFHLNSNAQGVRDIIGRI